MSEREFLQQLFLLQLDMEGNHMLEVITPERDRFARRLDDLLRRRTQSLSTSAAPERSQP
jgi:hypothetical protein